jgi:hypothetical protein
MRAHTRQCAAEALVSLGRIQDVLLRDDDHVESNIDIKGHGIDVVRIILHNLDPKNFPRKPFVLLVAPHCTCASCSVMASDARDARRSCQKCSTASVCAECCKNSRSTVSQSHLHMLTIAGQCDVPVCKPRRGAQRAWVQGHGSQVHSRARRSGRSSWARRRRQERGAAGAAWQHAADCRQHACRRLGGIRAAGASSLPFLVAIARLLHCSSIFQQLLR